MGGHGYRLPVSDPLVQRASADYFTAKLPLSTSNPVAEYSLLHG